MPRRRWLRPVTRAPRQVLSRIPRLLSRRRRNRKLVGLRIALFSSFRYAVRWTCAAEGCFIGGLSEGHVRCVDQYRSRAPAASGRSHLSSDPRVNTARALVERQRFAEALAILRPLVPDHPDQTDVRFLLGLAASRGSQDVRSRGGDGSRSWTRPSRRSGPS